MTNEARPRLRRRARESVLVGSAGLGLLCCAACADAVPPPTALDREPPALLSAFFGLDDALPKRTWLVCSDGPGADGMPVVFSRRLLTTSVDPAAFAVKLRSGVVRTPQCATTRPADDEPRTSHRICFVLSLALQCLLNRRAAVSPESSTCLASASRPPGSGRRAQHSGFPGTRGTERPLGGGAMDVRAAVEPSTRATGRGPS